MATDKPEIVVPLRIELDQERIKQIGRDLASAFDLVSQQLKAGAKQRAEAMEVAALFELFRQYTKGGKTGIETLGRIRAAVDGYDRDFRLDLARFADFMSSETERHTS